MKRAILPVILIAMIAALASARAQAPVPPEAKPEAVVQEWLTRWTKLDGSDEAAAQFAQQPQQPNIIGIILLIRLLDQFPEQFILVVAVECQRGAIELVSAKLLAELAENGGFRCEEMIPMEMLVSRDIFKKNAVASETIVCLRKV